ncbi:MAG: hypothetical protein HUJ98_13625, partial [Bacteroidaceae bacterium]|nr:hypothetical protein [Bacteroidaceae bacterium]
MIRKIIYTLLLSVLTINIYGASIKFTGCEPAHESILKSIQNFTLHFNIDDVKAEYPTYASELCVWGCVTIDMIAAKTGIMLYEGKGDTGTLLTYVGKPNPDLTYRYNSKYEAGVVDIDVSFDEEIILEKGKEYTLVIDKEVFGVRNKKNNVKVANTKSDTSFYITFYGDSEPGDSGGGEGGEDPQPTEKWTATPANNSMVDVLKSVQVTINEGLTDQVDVNEANITFVHPECKHADVDAYCQYVSKNTFNILWSQGDIYKQGEYKFTVANLKDVTISQQVGPDGEYYTDVEEHGVFDPIEITVNVDGSKESEYANIDATASVNTIGLDYIDIKLDGYEDNLSIVGNTRATIYKEDGTVFAENIVLSASYMGKYVRLNRNPFPNETANYYAVIPENGVMYKSRYFNEIRCDISVVKE